MADRSWQAKEIDRGWGVQVWEKSTQCKYPKSWRPAEPERGGHTLYWHPLSILRRQELLVLGLQRGWFSLFFFSSVNMSHASKQSSWHGPPERGKQGAYFSLHHKYLSDLMAQLKALRCGDNFFFQCLCISMLVCIFIVCICVKWSLAQ